MPYRRLPNTDNARIRALKKIIEKGRTTEGIKIIKADIIRLEVMLRNFSTAQMHYQSTLKHQAQENRKMMTQAKKARLYVSHFIQVLNLCIIRGEIKRDVKDLYGLEDDDVVPDMTSNESLLQWGEKILKGERDRLNRRGKPIYNPSIARVNVDFSLFKEAYIAQRLHQSNTNRHLDNLSGQRADIDEALVALWDQIEDFFQHLPRLDMVEQCKEYGVIYYIRNRKTNKN